MSRYVAFLRGMNLGRRRIKNAELCDRFREMGLGQPTAFLASGNVVFDSPDRDVDALSARIEGGLRQSLGYDVPTFLRSAAEVRRIARRRLFAERSAEMKGKVQVILLRGLPKPAARREVEGLATADDLLSVVGKQVFWLPRGSILSSELDLAAIARVVGPLTIRTHRTLVRLVDRFLAP